MHFRLTTFPRGWRNGVVYRAFESIKRHMREHGRNQPALRCPCFCWVKDVLLHISRFEPFLEHGLFHWNMGDEPFMRDRVETALNVSFEYPLGRSLFSQYLKALFYRIGGGPCWSKAVRVRVRCRFRHWVESKQVEGLHRPAFHDGHLHSTLPPLTS